MLTRHWALRLARSLLGRSFGRSLDSKHALAAAAEHCYLLPQHFLPSSGLTKLQSQHLRSGSQLLLLQKVQIGQPTVLSVVQPCISETGLGGRMRGSVC